MTDRELLEAAAKAAEIELCWFEVLDGDPDCAPGWYCTNVTAGGVWNPLTDDGDALRLAVKLRVRFMATGNLIDGTEVVSVILQVNGDWDAISEPTSADIYAATRRAIVRSAAAMAGEEA